MSKIISIPTFETICCEVCHTKYEFVRGDEILVVSEGTRTLTGDFEGFSNMFLKCPLCHTANKLKIKSE